MRVVPNDLKRYNFNDHSSLQKETVRMDAAAGDAGEMNQSGEQS
jgi:hypothetical protein